MNQKHRPIRLPCLYRLGAVLAIAALPFMAHSVVAQTFVDVTTASGITHVHCTAAQSSGVAGAFMAGGVVADDFDNDGWTDLIFTRLNDTDIFYRNRGDGTFEARTASAGFALPTITNAIAAGDIDNDGDRDVYMTVLGTSHLLYLNDGTGFFTLASPARGAAVATGVHRLGQGATFGDYDNDGYLDLMACDWGNLVANSQSRLLRNLGAANPGYFEDVTVAAGLNVYRGVRTYRFSARFVDLDRDGHQDLAIASDFYTSQLFWNNGDGTFTDGTIPAGVGTDHNGMGSTFGDFDRDGDLDWFITNITEDPTLPPTGFGGWNRLYRNDGNRVFTDVTLPAGVRDSRWSWGTTFFDFDNDGDLDLIATNGFNGAGWIDDRTFLWQNDNGIYTDISDAAGITDRLQGRGLAHLDYDNDGDLDIVIINNQAAPILYRNDGGNMNDYLRIEVEGTTSNRDGIGAFIRVTPDLSDPGQQMVWEIDGGSSFLSQNERTAHFGLGNSSGTVDLVSITWPTGLVEHYCGIAANQTVRLFEGDASSCPCDAANAVAGFNAFLQCFAGPAVAPAVSCPAGFDSDCDGDGDVDLREFAEIQRATLSQ